MIHIEFSYLDLRIYDASIRCLLKKSSKIKSLFQLPLFNYKSNREFFKFFPTNDKEKDYYCFLEVLTLRKELILLF